MTCLPCNGTGHVPGRIANCPECLAVGVCPGCGTGVSKRTYERDQDGDGVSCDYCGWREDDDPNWCAIESLRDDARRDVMEASL